MAKNEPAAFCSRILSYPDINMNKISRVNHLFKLKVKNTDIVICFSFVAVFTLCVLLYSEKVIVISVASSLLHECGHIAAMRANGVTIKEIRFYGGGMKITRDLSCIPFSQELFVTFAGVLVNFCLCLLSYCFFKTIFSVNLAILIFNLLPIGCLDGARTLELISDKYPRIKPLLVTVKTIFCALLLCLCFYSFMRLKISISVFVTVLFLTVGEIVYMRKK